MYLDTSSLRMHVNINSIRQGIIPQYYYGTLAHLCVTVHTISMVKLFMHNVTSLAVTNCVSSNLMLFAPLATEYLNLCRF